jgi:TonB-linked SusC/RagA family outer membrane protein
MIQQLRKIRATMLCALFALTWFVDGYAVDGMSKYAQQQSVSGIVRSPEGDGIPGVNVIVKGTTQGVTTDASGNYTIMVPGPNTTLVFSFVGYQTQEIVVNNQTVINVQMALELTALDEIVVIGYGQREKKDLTGAVAQISSEEITKQVSMSPEMAMQGRMSGVFVSNPGSGPTARPEIRIRGVGTLNNNDPLYVIDGIPLAEGGAARTASTSGANDRRSDLRGPVNVFALINPNDIESISVLKDASATAIYGVRAASGVILITTKRGKQGKPRVNFSSSIGVQNINKRYDVMDVEEYVEITREAWANRPGYVAGAPDVFLFDPNHAEYLGNSKTYSKDWIENAFVKNAMIQDYNLSISGGNDVSNYAVGAGISDQEDAVFADRFKRYSLFVNSDHKVTPWLTLGETMRVVYAQNATAGSRPGFDVSFVAPWQPFYDENDPTGYARPGGLVDGTFRANRYGTGSMTNFRGQAPFRKNERDIIRNIGSLYAEVKPLKGLRVRGTYSVDHSYNIRETFEDQRFPIYNHTSGVINPNAGNTYDRRINENLNLVGEFLVGYNRSFGNHNVDVILNAMDQKIYWNNTQMSMLQRSPIPNWEQRRIEEGWSPTDKGMFYERVRYGLQGYMGRISYNYHQKYYVDATIRRDGTSRFAPGLNWGTFPSVAAAWRISSESFMDGLDFLSDLKLRAGYGKVGNENTQEYAFLSLINVNPKAAFGSSSDVGNGAIGDAAALQNFASPDLTWETHTTFNVGFDSEFLQGKFRFSAEYYSRFADDILQTYPIPALIGFTGNPVVNLAQVSNTGFEFEGEFNQQFGDITFNAGFNLTTVRNRVLKLYNDVPTGGGSATSGRIQVGESMNSLFGYKTAGIFQTQAEVDEYMATTNDPGYTAFKGPGDVRYVDFAGAPPSGAHPSIYQSIGADGTVNNFDQTIIGKTIPGYYYGINLGAMFRNFDLSLFFRGMGDVNKATSLGLLSVGGAGGNYVIDYRNRWTEENPSNKIPRAIQGDPSGNGRFSDRFVHDAGFIRLQNVQLGYTLPSDLVSKLGLSTARVTATGTNLFVISPYPDLDPENITTPTTFILGLNFGF